MSFITLLSNLKIHFCLNFLLSHQREKTLIKEGVAYQILRKTLFSRSDFALSQSQELLLSSQKEAQYISHFLLELGDQIPKSSVWRKCRNFGKYMNNCFKEAR